MKLNGGHSIAQVEDRSARVLFDDALRLLDGGEGGDAFSYRDRYVSRGDRVEVLAAAGDAGAVAVPGGVRLLLFLGIGQEFFHVGRNRGSSRAHLVGGDTNARSVEHLERSKLPVVPRLHRLIDLNDVVCNLGYAVSAVSEQLSQERPIEGSGFVLARIAVKELRDAQMRVFHVLRHLDR